MTDGFAVLGVSRRPFLAEEELKANYFERAAVRHPDATSGGTEAFRELQEAFAVLSDPGKRLRHLQELEFPGFQKAPAAGAHGELFLTIGQAVQSAQSVLQRHEKAQSALARALLVGEVTAAAERIRSALQDVLRVRDRLQSELLALDARWPGVTAEEVSLLASQLLFLARWQTELAEWEFRISQAAR